MATTITITGKGGVKAGGGTFVNTSGGYINTPDYSGGVVAVPRSPTPVELHGDQWGLFRFDMKPRPEQTF